MKPCKLIAFYLTQFHPIPENDEWWGKGFTEWTNTVKARPLFAEHYQPHLPSDLGFYDLRLREVRHEQIALAKQYGIDGFCYHYYWFSGKRLLEQPLDDMLRDPASDMPFCLCWANENWTRRWTAAENEILIKQDYLPDDDVRFARDLLCYLRDERYIRINGAPLLIVYRPQQMPDPKQSAETWRRFFRENGIGEIHLCAALTHGNLDYRQFGFDSGVEFPPHNLTIKLVNDRMQYLGPFFGRSYLFHEVAEEHLNRKYPGGNVFRTVFPSWDNTARTNHRALTVLNGTPENYEHWLAKTIHRTKTSLDNPDNLVFINAWNEWAEGCHLEADQKYGRQFLEATLRAKTESSLIREFQHRTIPEGAARERQSFLRELVDLINRHLYYWWRAAQERAEKMPKTRKFLRRVLLKR